MRLCLTERHSWYTTQSLRVHGLMVHSQLVQWIIISFMFQEKGDNQPYCWRNVFSCINLLRILNKLTKWKHSRTMVCLHYTPLMITLNTCFALSLIFSSINCLILKSCKQDVYHKTLTSGCIAPHKNTCLQTIFSKSCIFAF